MDKNNAQELFLVEFLVIEVNIPSVQAIRDNVLEVKTCIEFKVLSLPAIFICQDSPTDCCSCIPEEKQFFRKGKSCLFALPAKVLCKPICSFPITMTVYKKLPPTVLPDVMTIGSCQLDARDIFNCLLKENPNDNPFKTLKNNFRISTATGQCVGEVCVFLRFSRLGKKVVTQFQNPHNKKPYLFKGLDNSPVIQCRRIPSKIDENECQESCICKKEEPKCPPPPRTCCGPPPPPPPIDPCSGDKDPCSGDKDPCGGSRKKSKSKCGSKKPKGSRPCCPLKDKPQSKCGDMFEKTRKCGCDIKAEKSSCCK